MREVAVQLLNTPGSVMQHLIKAITVFVMSVVVMAPAFAGQQQAVPAPQASGVPDGYVVGVDDVLAVVFWRSEEMSAEVRVRPDGRISLPLLNDIEVIGLTPEQLRERVTDAARQYVEEPTVSVVVREINSRKAFITGQVARPGSYSLVMPTTVLQLIAIAGGLTDYAASSQITIVSSGDSKPRRFNYDDVRKGRKLEQNVEVRIGDTVIVP